jgi:hypothetical protein
MNDRSSVEMIGFEYQPVSASEVAHPGFIRITGPKMKFLQTRSPCLEEVLERPTPAPYRR